MTGKLPGESGQLTHLMENTPPIRNVKPRNFLRDHLLNQPFLQLQMWEDFFGGKTVLERCMKPEAAFTSFLTPVIAKRALSTHQTKIKQPSIISMSLPRHCCCTDTVWKLHRSGQNCKSLPWRPVKSMLFRDHILYLPCHAVISHTYLTVLLCPTFCMSLWSPAAKPN